MRSSFEDASQGPRMVCSVGRSVDARAGCAVLVRSSGSHSEQARRHGDSPQVCSAVQIFLEMITSRFFERKVIMGVRLSIASTIRSLHLVSSLHVAVITP